MIKNYFKIAIRNILRNRVFSFINIIGLSVGLASVIMIILYVKHEVSYDKFFDDSERIYRVISVFKDNDKTHEFPVTLYGVAPSLKDEVPEISNATRFFRPGESWVEYNQENYGKYWHLHTDNNFLDVLSYKLIRGNKETCLSKPNTVVLTERVANEIFGNKEPLNKVIRLHEKDYTVTGILENVPTNSHLRFDFLISINSYDEETLRNDGNSHYTYYKLKQSPNSQLDKKVIESVSNYVNTRFEQYDIEYGFKVQPLLDIHLHSDYNPDYAVVGNKEYIYIFSLIAIFILLIAAVNFINLSIAKADNRKKEVGIRKVNGANKRHLRTQFIGESVFIAFISFLLAMLIVETFLDDFSGLVSSRLSFAYSQNVIWIIGFALLSVVVGIASGIYPAYYISSFNSIRILKGEQVSGKKRSPVQVLLVVFQFTIAVALIASLFGIGSQVNYLKNKDLGFDKDNVIVAYGFTKKIRKNYESIKNEILDDPSIEAVTASMAFPGSGTSGMNLKLKEESPEEAFPVRENRVQPDFVKTYGIKIVEGRDFSEDRASDENAFLINETAAKMLGVDNIIGREVDVWTNRGKVIGVFKDFHTKSLHHKIEPFVLSRYKRQIYVISARYQAGQAERARKHLSEVLNGYDPDYTYQYFFVDDYWDNKYSREDKSAKLIIAGTILTIIISIMGLFALTALNINQRTKEIGIRKSLGASVKVITQMLLKQYLKWVLLAAFIAIPFAFVFIENWLNNFAYRISIHWWFFLLAIIIALFISTGTILIKVLRAANTNPANTLRYE